MISLQRITTARREFVVRYGQYPNAIMLGPNAELELQEHGARLTDLLGMRVFLTPDIQDFIVCLIHDHTV